MSNGTNASSNQQVRAGQIEAARVELARCLRLLGPLFPEPDFAENLPEIVIVDDYAPLPELPLCAKKSHQIVLYTRGDLNRPPEQLLTTLLHQAVHAANAFSWLRDCTSLSYHTRAFRRLAEAVGFTVPRLDRRYGWAKTLPTPRLMRLLDDLAVDRSLLQPFHDRATPVLRKIRHHCGLSKLPDRDELSRWLGDPVDHRDMRYRPEWVVRSAKVHRVRQGDDYVPMLQMKGQWLRRFGFLESSRMKIDVRFGQLTIQARHPLRGDPRGSGLRPDPD